MPSRNDSPGWTCPTCGRWEDGTGPCAHTGPPKQNAEMAWLREDLKKAGAQIKAYEEDRRRGR